MATELTEPLRSEHRDLVSKLDALRVLGATLDSWEPGRTDVVLAEVISMLRHNLLPHARAEEAVLYPAVEQAMGASGAMATMVADHRRSVPTLGCHHWRTPGCGSEPAPDRVIDAGSRRKARAVSGAR